MSRVLNDVCVCVYVFMCGLWRRAENTHNPLVASVRGQEQTSNVVQVHICDLDSGKFGKLNIIV